MKSKKIKAFGTTEYRNEPIIGRILTQNGTIGCCEGQEYYLIYINGGYTTECKCGSWCGQWYETPGDAIEYFENMVRRRYSKPYKGSKEIIAATIAIDELEI